MGKERLVQEESLSGIDMYTMLAVPMEVVGLVAWKIDKALFIDLRLEILLVSLVCFSISEGFKVMMIILISKAKIAITMSNSIRVKDLLFFSCLMYLNIDEFNDQVPNQKFLPTSRQANKFTMNKIPKQFKI